MKHPMFRVRNILDLDKSALDELEILFKQIIKLLSHKPVDVEIVGSYANGCAGLHSDLDIAMPMKDWNGQIQLRRAFYSNVDLEAKVHALLSVFSEKYGIKIDFNPAIPDNKENKIYATYSLFERKLYNTPANLYERYLVISPYTQKYFLKQYDREGTPVDTRHDVPAITTGKWALDEFKDEVPKWKTIYKDKFIDYKVTEKGELTEA